LIKKIIFLISLLLFPVLLMALSPEEIISKVDKNEVFTSIKYKGVMTIQKGDRAQPRIKEFEAISKGNDKAFIEFTNPGDKGTKYLKFKDELWIKGPYADEATKISGHLLRQNMMGSDYSYEDVVNNEGLLDLYNVRLIGKEELPSGECYKLELTAKVKKIAYVRQMIWVDAQEFVARKVQYFALSGQLVKELTVIKTEMINGKFFPVIIKMENKQRQNTYTIFEMKSIDLDIPLDDTLFSKRQLEK